MKRLPTILATLLLLTSVSVSPSIAAAATAKSSLPTELKKEYYKETMNIIHEYGIYSGRAPIPSYAGISGLAYANLVKFKGVKNSVLLLLYISRQSEFAYDLWDGDKQLVNGWLPLGSGIVSYGSANLDRLRDGMLYVHVINGGQGGGTGVQEDDFYTISRLKWVEVAALIDKWSQNNATDTINVYDVIKNKKLRPVSASVYKDIFKRYAEGKNTKLFSDSWGYNYFASHTSRNRLRDGEIYEFLARLRK
nr:hypothetical protein [Bacilli bacterium]